MTDKYLGYTNNVIKGSTVKGKHYIEIYNSLKGKEMTDVYTNISHNFKNVWNKLHSYYQHDVLYNDGTEWKNSYKAGSWSWSCGWKFKYYGENAIRVETRSNTYIVLVDR